MNGNLLDGLARFHAYAKRIWSDAGDFHQCTAQGDGSRQHEDGGCCSGPTQLADIRIAVSLRSQVDAELNEDPNRLSSLISLALSPILFSCMLLFTSAGEPVMDDRGGAAILGAVISVQLFGVAISWRKPPSGELRATVRFAFVSAELAVVGLFVAGIVNGADTSYIYYPPLFVSIAILGYQCLYPVRYPFRGTQRP